MEGQEASCLAASSSQDPVPTLVEQGAFLLAASSSQGPALSLSRLLLLLTQSSCLEEEEAEWLSKASCLEGCRAQVLQVVQGLVLRQLQVLCSHREHLTLLQQVTSLTLLQQTTALTPRLKLAVVRDSVSILGRHLLCQEVLCLVGGSKPLH